MEWINIDMTLNIIFFFQVQSAHFEQCEIFSDEYTSKQFQMNKASGLGQS